MNLTGDDLRNALVFVCEGENAYLERAAKYKKSKDPKLKNKEFLIKMCLEQAEKAKQLAAKLRTHCFDELHKS